MPRVAIVTGGTRGIGAAICQGAESRRLQGRGQLRRQRRGGTEIQGRNRHRRLQMGRFLVRGLRRRRQAGRGRSGPDRRAGQQCRHHPRRPASPHEARAVDGGDQHQSRLAVQHVPPGDRGHARAQIRPHHQYFVDQRPEGPIRPDQLFGRQSRRDRLHQGAGAGRRAVGITVNAIAPGYINTEMVQAVPKDVLEKSILPTIPIGRLGEPEEIGRCVVFLASDDAGLITGSTLTANGGQYIT